MSSRANDVAIWLLGLGSICMQIISPLAQREHCHCHFTRYTINHRWSSISNCAMDLTSKEALTSFSVLLVFFFHPLHVRRSPVQTGSAYRHDVFNSLMHLRHAASFCWQLHMTAAERCRNIVKAVGRRKMMHKKNLATRFMITHQ